MAARDENPYRSPDADVEYVPRRSLLRSCWSLPVMIGLIVLMGMCATQGRYRTWAKNVGLKLPAQTELCLQPIVPSLVWTLLCASAAVRHMISAGRRRRFFDMASLVVLGTMGGYYAFALLLPLLTIHWVLS